MKIGSVTFRDDIHKPGTTLETTRFIDARPRPSKDDPKKTDPTEYSLEFQDGMLEVRTVKGVTLVPWTNIVDMQPLPEAAKKRA